MRNAVNQAVLILNSSFEPISIRSARRALTLVVKDRAIVQEHTGREIYPGIMFPSVIRLKEFRYIPVRVQILSRKNILLRDRYTCQYCDKVLPPGQLTLDHIVPRAKGGKDSWANLVCACGDCNRRKADMSLEESGMRLRHMPRPSSIHTSRFILKSMGEDSPLWKKYLYYDSSESAGVFRN